jgi:hypothetical protein
MAVPSEGKPVPATSKKQERFMQAVANNPEFAKKVGVPTSVGREFTKGKDMKKMKKMAGGGMPMGPDGKPTFVGDGKGKMAKGGMAKMKAGGGVSSASKRADGVAVKGKTKGKLLAKGGMTKMSNGGKC